MQPLYISLSRKNMKNSLVYDEILKLLIQNRVLNPFSQQIFQCILTVEQNDFLYSPIHGKFTHKIKIVIQNSNAICLYHRI
jgi:hypothetical protein